MGLVKQGTKRAPVDPACLRTPQPMTRGSRSTALCVVMLAIAAAWSGCASPVKTEPVVYITSAGGQIDITQETIVTLPQGYRSRLSAGTRWQKVGTVPQGEVYRIVSGVFTIAGRNVHEAYLVLTPARALVGFYLPGESNLSPLASPVPLSTKEVP